jgi:hypothetical protein
MLLHWDSYLFEFMPFQKNNRGDEIDVAERGTRSDASGGERLVVTELKVGTLYEVLVTTPFGLYSYRIGDVLRLESKNPYRFTVVGRTKTTLNMFGEKVCEDHLSTALSAAETSTRTVVSDYSCMVAGNGNGGPRYVLYVEFIKPPGDVEKFVIAWDNELQRVAPAYACFRARNTMLKQPEMVTLAKGTFQRYEQRRTSSQHASGQLKPIHIISAGELPEEFGIPLETR